MNAHLLAVLAATQDYWQSIVQIHILKKSNDFLMTWKILVG